MAREATIHDHARSGNLAAAMPLLSRDREAASSQDRLFRTPVHLAAWAGHASFIETLVAFG